MPANGNYLIFLTAVSIALLLVLILAVKLHAFLALLLTSMALGLAAHMPPEKVLKSIQTGFGDALGFIVVVVGLGAMIGRFLEHSGGAQVLADWLVEKFGKDRAAWSFARRVVLSRTADFFEVGFVIMAPLVWNLARETKPVAFVLWNADGRCADDHHAFAGCLRIPRRPPRRNCWGETWAQRSSTASPFPSQSRSLERHVLRQAGSRSASVSRRSRNC